MDCKAIYIAMGTFAAASVAPAELSAFEQQSPGVTAPPIEAVPSVPSAKPGVSGIPLDSGTGNVGEGASKKKLAIPGLGSISLPKLNFGLDLMYGNPENDSNSLSITNDPLVGDDDLKIMGKVKRRF